MTKTHQSKMLRANNNVGGFLRGQMVDPADVDPELLTVLTEGDVPGLSPWDDKPVPAEVAAQMGVPTEDEPAKEDATPRKR